MPQIEEYNNTENLSGQPFEGAAYSMFRLGRAEAEAIQQGGNALRQGVNAVDQHIARAETNKIATNAAQMNQDLYAQWQQVKQNADPNDPNVAKKFYEETVQPALEKATDGYMTQAGQDAARRTAASLSTTWFEHTAADQANMDAAAVSNAAAGVTDSASSAAYSDPASLHHQLDLIQSTIGPLADSHNAGSAAKEKLIREASSKVVYSAYLGGIDKNSQQALTELQKDHAGFGYLSGQQLAELTERAQNKVETQQDQQNGVDRVQFADDMDRMAAGFSGTRNWSKEDAEALGNTPAQKAELGAKWEVANAVGKENTLARKNDWSLQDQAKHVQSLNQGLSSAPNFEAAAKAADTAQKALDKRTADFKKDPSAYVAKNNPAVADAWQKALAEDAKPEDFQAALSASTAAQLRVNPQKTPQVVPSFIAQNIGQSLKGVDQEGGAERAQSALGQWQQKFGTQWPQAVAEMSQGKNKVMTPEIAFAANLSAEGKHGLATDMLNAINVKNAPGGSDVDTRRKNTEKAVRIALGKLANTTVADGAGGQTFINQQADALTKLAMYKGLSGSDVRELVKDTISGNYTFHGTMRIPTGIDSDGVIKGAQAIQAGLTDKGLSNADASRVKEHGFWVTSNGDTGLRLVDDAKRQVFDNKGQPIERTWDQLLGKAPLPTKPAPQEHIRADNVPLSAPVEPKDMVRAAAKENGVPEHIALGQIDFESGGFNVNPNNPKLKIGGLGQLTQDFVKTYSKPGENPKDPQTNVNIAMRGLAALKAKYGSWNAALAAYNGGDDPNYVQHVMARAKRYQ